LLVAQQETQYGERRFQIDDTYEIDKTTYFDSFLYKTPLTEDIYGGWKVHISLDPSNINNIGLAWTDIIVPELLICGVGEFKIVVDGYLHKLVEGAEGQGKLITVYLRHNPELALNQPNHRKLIETFNRIEAGLIFAGIQPGPRPVIDHMIQGSRYMSFRCDALLPEHGTTEWQEGVVYALEDDKAPAIAAENSTPAYNPFNIQDEYGLYELTLEPQQAPAFNPI
jgi:hypothetical protein